MMHGNKVDSPWERYFIPQINAVSVFNWSGIHGRPGLAWPIIVDYRWLSRGLPCGLASMYFRTGCSISYIAKRL